MLEYAGWQFEDTLDGPIPPIQMDKIAFVGAYHNEGVRLARILTQTKPWFKHRVIALQGPTHTDANVAEYLMDRPNDTIIVQEKLGFGEASFPTIMKVVRAAHPEVEWVFYMDGDELAEPSLLASMHQAIQTDRARESGGVRLIKRSNITLGGGDVLPGVAEINLRLWKVDCGRPPHPHSWVEGIVGEPAFWPIGAVRETRSLDEYIVDQMRYATEFGSKETERLFDETARHMLQFMSSIEVKALFMHGIGVKNEKGLARFMPAVLA